MAGPELKKKGFLKKHKTHYLESPQRLQNSSQEWNWKLSGYTDGEE